MSTAELLENYPHESAIVLQRGVEISIILGGFLAAHCASLAWQFPPCGDDPGLVLWALCVLRILSFVPRTQHGVRAHREVMCARCQPTPQLITKSLVEIRAPSDTGFFRQQMMLYLWLACSFIAACALDIFGCKHVQFPAQLRWHCLLNVLSLVLHKVLCVIIFVITTSSGGKRGIAPYALEECTRQLQFLPDDAACMKALGLGEMDCSICLGGYEIGQDLRLLSCRHHFHKACVDTWLLQRRNHCPLCLSVVGGQVDATCHVID